MRERFRHCQQRGRARAIIISAVVNDVTRVAISRRKPATAGQGQPLANVIVVRAERNILVLQNRVCAFPYPDDVLRVLMLAAHADCKTHLLRRL